MKENKVHVKIEKFNNLVALTGLLFVLQLLSALFLDKPWNVVFSVLTLVLGGIFLLRMRRKAESFFTEYHQLLEEENQLSTLLHSLPDFVCFKDGEGRWLKVNQFGRQLYNLENIDYLGKTDRELEIGRASCRERV